MPSIGHGVPTFKTALSNYLTQGVHVFGIGKAGPTLGLHSLTYSSPLFFPAPGSAKYKIPSKELTWAPGEEPPQSPWGQVEHSGPVRGTSSHPLEGSESHAAGAEAVPSRSCSHLPGLVERSSPWHSGPARGGGPRAPGLQARPSPPRTHLSGDAGDESNLPELAHLAIPGARVARAVNGSVSHVASGG